MKTGTDVLFTKGRCESAGEVFYNNFFDTPIIVTNKLLLRCVVRDGAYIPTEIISMHKFLTRLKELNASERNNNALMNNRPLDSLSYTAGQRPLKGSINQRHEPTYQRRQKSTSVSSVLLELSTDTGYNSSINNDNNNENDNLALRNKCINRENSLTINEQHSSEDEDTIINENNALLATENNDVNCREHRNDVQAKYEDHVHWMMEDNDYISMETVPSLDDFEVLLDVIIKCGCPMGLSVRAGNAYNGFTVLLHLIENFKKDFMVVRIGEKHCL